MSASERYARQATFHGIGTEGQRRIEETTVLLVGLGALGAAVSEQLVRAGIRLIAVDRDYVDESNLQRQCLYTDEDALNGIPKAVAASRRLREVNGEASVTTHIADVDVAFLRDMPPVDLVLDATDNVETRLLLNDFALECGVPFLFASCVGSYGMNVTVFPEEGPCCRCLMKHLPLSGQTCATVGVIAPIVQMVASRQVAEVLKYASGATEAMERRLCVEDVWHNQSQRLDVTRLRQEGCPSCQTNERPSLKRAHGKTTTLCGRDVVQVRRRKEPLEGVAARLRQGGVPVHETPYMIEWKWRGKRLLYWVDGRVMVHGTDDSPEAVRLVDECLG